MTVYVAWRCAYGHTGIDKDSLRVFSTPENVGGFWQAERKSNGLPELPQETMESILSPLRSAGEAECIVCNRLSAVGFDHARAVEVDGFYTDNGKE